MAIPSNIMRGAVDISKSKVAFTLAEVLITLGIIGVVAAMTLPSLINNYKKAVVVSQLKKTYSVLEQTVKMAEKDYGPINDWDEWDDAEAILNKYFVPYLQGAKSFGKADTYVKAMCYDSTVKNHVDTTKEQSPYVWLSGVHMSNPFYKDITASISLNNGACIGLDPILTEYPWHSRFIILDVNGSRKGPNVAGEDLFMFYINSNGFIKPYGDTLPLDTIKSKAYSNACNYEASLGGHTCAARIMKEGWRINYWDN